ncbi:3'-5' exonuclease [Legionella drozanskii]|nr:3'-5' exonuclease [Legionella drozanskii]
MTEELISLISQHSEYQLLKRVPSLYTPRTQTDSQQFIATIIDLETMGLDASLHEIIELGLLSFSFSKADGILAVIDTYNELNDPGKPIPLEVTQVTGISNEDVQGKAIDWLKVTQILSSSHLIICHNSGFDRNFLELQTPASLKPIVQALPFGCTMKDIDWKKRLIESSKLDYINWKLGYFYDGHRALNDCWATFNLLIQDSNAFEELKANVRKKETLLVAAHAPFDKKDLLKQRDYRWSDGLNRLPKSWWKIISNEHLLEEKQWLDEVIYGKPGASNALPSSEIGARIRYSFRAEMLEV